MNFGEFDQKTVGKSIINTIFKQQVISEPQKLHKISYLWALVAYIWTFADLVWCSSLMRLLSLKLICKWVSTREKIISTQFSEKFTSKNKAGDSCKNHSYDNKTARLTHFLQICETLWLTDELTDGQTDIIKKVRYIWFSMLLSSSNVRSSVIGIFNALQDWKGH